jgi:hypothetical protein
VLNAVENKGDSIRRTWKKKYLSQLQTDVFFAFKPIIPNLERATNYKEKGLKAPRQTHHKNFRAEQEKNKLKNQYIKKILMKMELIF